MLVRAKITHFNKAFRVQGEQFEWDAPLHKHIERVEPSETPKAKTGKQGKTKEPGEE